MDYSAWHEKITQPFRTPRTMKVLAALDRALVIGFAAAYVALLAFLLVTGDGFLARAFIVPAVTFALVTGARLAVNRLRPYEAHDIDPLITKDTRGKSMPSRHMASATIIAFTFCLVWPIAGTALFVACACVAFTRIIGGVHYPTDILAAVACALACGAVGFFVV